MKNTGCCLQESKENYMKTQDEKNQTISIKVSRADYKILQQIKIDQDIPSMAKVINGLLNKVSK